MYPKSLFYWYLTKAEPWAEVGTSLLLSPMSLRLHPAATPTSPGLRESEMTQGADVLLSRESADAETEGREHLEFRLFSSTKTSTGQKKREDTVGCT